MSERRGIYRGVLATSLNSDPYVPPSERADITPARLAFILARVKEARSILAKSRNVGTTAHERDLAAMEAENVLAEAMEGVREEGKND